MVICSSCKQYTDDQGTVCEHCGAPLVPDRLEGLRAGVGVDDWTAQLIADRGRAQRVASGIVAQHISDFFYAGPQRRTVLVELFGFPPDPPREAAALLFVAVVYLVQRGYCALRGGEEEASPLWDEVRAWDGQRVSLEGALARQAGLGRTLFQAFQQVIAEAVRPALDLERQAGRRPRETAPAPRAADAVMEVARRTVLPDYAEAEACREIYQMLLQFVRQNPALARRVAEEVVQALSG